MEFRRVLFLSKFTTKGVITLTVMRRQNPAGDVIMIEVRDTGIGTSKDGLSKLFQSFSQAETTTENRYGGTGIGPALTRRSCSSMGGTLEVESALGVDRKSVVTGKSLSVREELGCGRSIKKK